MEKLAESFPIWLVRLRYRPPNHDEGVPLAVRDRRSPQTATAGNKSHWSRTLLIKRACRQNLAARVYHRPTGDYMLVNGSPGLDIQKCEPGRSAWLAMEPLSRHLDVSDKPARTRISPAIPSR